VQEKITKLGSTLRWQRDLLPTRPNRQHARPTGRAALPAIDVMNAGRRTKSGEPLHPNRMSLNCFVGAAVPRRGRSDMRILRFSAALFHGCLLLTASGAPAQDEYGELAGVAEHVSEQGGGGIIIKGYDIRSSQAANASPPSCGRAGDNPSLST